jgi:hypothetical protein
VQLRRRWLIKHLLHINSKYVSFLCLILFYVAFFIIMVRGLEGVSGLGLSGPLRGGPATEPSSPESKLAASPVVQGFKASSHTIKVYTTLRC